MSATFSRVAEWLRENGPATADDIGDALWPEVSGRCVGGQTQSGGPRLRSVVATRQLGRMRVKGLVRQLRPENPVGKWPWTIGADAR